MSKQHIKLEQFEGPLSLLLQLIEQEELEITEISLAQVTDQYVEVLEAQKDLHPEEIADFLVMASRLLLLKSRVLLASDQVDDDEVNVSDLERQLKMYKEYVDASKHINVNWKSTKEFFVRARPLKVLKIKFVPPQVGVEDFYNIISSVVSELEPIMKIKTKKIDLTVTMKDKIGMIKRFIQENATFDFKRLLSEAPSKTERIVSFLAVLEMVKQREVQVVQEVMFAEITIKKF